MNKTKVFVPKGIRFINEWTDFDLSQYQYPFILDKVLTGCGFTSYCLENRLPTILCSPRKKLLQNKYEQTPGSFYLDIDPKDKREDIIRKGQELGQYLSVTQIPKILTTYDSFRHVRRIVGEEYIGLFYVIVDEFSSIFNDSQFKGDVELDFVSYLCDLNKVCFVSATPYIEGYLDEVEVFKDLPYIELDWNSLEPGRVKRPSLPVIQQIQSISEKASCIIKKYQDGSFEKFYYTDENGDFRYKESKEAVIYVNSVEMIIRIVNRCNLTQSQVNVLCAETMANRNKLKKIGLAFGKIPLKGQPHKMFTFCTSTCYLGCDFYSDNARSFIFSDGNVDCLATDISMDLPQILGRQRLEENPWKGTAEFYYKTKTEYEDYEKILQARLDETANKMRLVEANENDTELKNQILTLITNDSSNKEFKKYYLTVSSKGTLEFNKFVYLSQRRAYEISQIDYRDRFFVMSSVRNTGIDTLNPKFRAFVDVMDSLGKIDEKLRYFVYNTDLTDEEKLLVMDYVPYSIKNIYLNLGPERIKQLGCVFRYCRKELEQKTQYTQTLFEQEIYKEFKVGDTYTNAELKSKLQKIYEACNGPVGKMSASDLSDYFELKQSKHIMDGKRVICQTLIKKLKK